MCLSWIMMLEQFVSMAQRFSQRNALWKQWFMNGFYHAVTCDCITANEKRMWAHMSMWCKVLLNDCKRNMNESTQVYVMQANEIWNEKQTMKVMWMMAHMSMWCKEMCDTKKCNEEWLRSTHVYVMQRNLIWDIVCMKVQMRNGWKAHMSVWYNKCDMKDVMWTDKSIWYKMYETWCISGCKWQKWMRKYMSMCCKIW